MAVVLTGQKVIVWEDMRFRDVVVLQMRTVVQTKDLGRRLAALLQKDANDVDRQCADVQRTSDRLAQLFRRMVFQKSQDLDEFTTALTAQFRFETQNMTVISRPR